jgi:hypothetical protein
MSSTLEHFSISYRLLQLFQAPCSVSRRRHINFHDPRVGSPRNLAPKELAYSYASSHKRCDRFDRTPPSVASAACGESFWQGAMIPQAFRSCRTFTQNGRARRLMYAFNLGADVGSSYSNHMKAFGDDERPRSHEGWIPSSQPSKHGPITSVGSNQIDRSSLGSSMDLLRLSPAASSC